MSLAVATTAPVGVGIMVAPSAPSFYSASFYPNDDAQRRLPQFTQTNEVPSVSYDDDDDEVLKVRRMQQLHQEVSDDDDDDERPADMHLDSNTSKELSSTSRILQDSLCCFSEMTEINSYLLPQQSSPHCYHPRRRSQGRGPVGVRIDEGRNTYHSYHQGASAIPVSFMVRMGLATATEEELERQLAENDGSVSSWLQQADYAAIKRDNIKTLLAIQQQVQNPSAQHSPNDPTYDGNPMALRHDDEACPRGLETVIEKMLRRPATSGEGRSSISHQRRVSQLIVQLYRTHRALRSRPYQQQSHGERHIVIPASPMEYGALSSSTLEEDVRAMYEMVSQTDRIRALTLAEQDARDVGHQCGVSLDL
jgi:hypothetical protein